MMYLDNEHLSCYVQQSPMCIMGKLSKINLKHILMYLFFKNPDCGHFSQEAL